MSVHNRSNFDIPRDICYLNAADMTPQPHDVVEAAIRGDHLRVAPHLYTDEEDLARFDGALGAAVG